MDEMTCQVYVRTDETGRVTAINSSAFLHDTTGWTLLAEGCGDRYLHAQGNFLPDALTDDRGVPRYRLEAGQLVTRSQQEMDADSPQPSPAPDLASQVAHLQQELARLMAQMEA